MNAVRTINNILNIIKKRVTNIFDIDLITLFLSSCGA